MGTLKLSKGIKAFLLKRRTKALLQRESEWRATALAYGLPLVDSASGYRKSIIEERNILLEQIRNADSAKEIQKIKTRSDKISKKASRQDRDKKRDEGRGRG